MNKGLSWLDDRKWSDVTRDERFFCANLYTVILNHREGIPGFVRVINRECGLNLPENANWELGYEVCFYRDMWFDNPDKYECVSPKRTFDLCLFSDEKIVIIEAKAYQAFDLDQTADFDADKENIEKRLALPVEVVLVPLASSLYKKRFESSSVKETFDGSLLTWFELAKFYGNDRILGNADRCFGRRPKSTNKANNYCKGAQLKQMYQERNVNPETFWIGRSGGLQSLKNDDWLNRDYAVDAEAVNRPNRNWFNLKEFMDVVLSN